MAIDALLQLHTHVADACASFRPNCTERERKRQSCSNFRTPSGGRTRDRGLCGGKLLGEMVSEHRGRESAHGCGCRGQIADYMPAHVRQSTAMPSGSREPRMSRRSVSGAVRNGREIISAMSAYWRTRATRLQRCHAAPQRCSNCTRLDHCDVNNACFSGSSARSAHETKFNCRPSSRRSGTHGPCEASKRGDPITTQSVPS